MQLFHAPAARTPERLSLWGVRLTTVDEEEEYANESLGSAIEKNYAGRHLARLAHLYFARHTTLTAVDYEFNILSLVKKILGPYPMSPSDWGWLGTMQPLPPYSQSIRRELQRDLEATFSKDKYNSEQQKTFRVFQLLDPQEPGNLFSVIYMRDSSLYRYLYPMSELPPATEDVLKRWREGQETFVPLLYVQICGSPPKFSDDSLLIGLSDWFTLRLVNWFVGAPSRISGNVSIKQSIGPAGRSLVPDANAVERPGSFWTTSVDAVCRSVPAMEIFQGYLEALLPHSDFGKANGGPEKMLPARSRAIFRWAVADLWLNRVKGSPRPTGRLLQGLYLLVTHLAVEPSLSQSEPLNTLPVDHATLRAPLTQFFSYWLGELTFDTETPLDSLIDLWCVLLTPWSASARLETHNRSRNPLAGVLPIHAKPPVSVAAGNPNEFKHIWFVVHHCVIYLTLLNLTLRRLDQESNASLRSLEAVARAFRNEGPFAPTVMFILLECEKLYSPESSARPLPQSIQKLPGKEKITQLFEDESIRQLVQASITQQLEEVSKIPGAPKSLAIMDGESLRSSFIRQLRLKKEIAMKTEPSESKASHADILADCERMCSLLNLEIDLKKGTASHGHRPIVLERVFEGVPSWITGKTIKFRGLTDAGRKLLRKSHRMEQTRLSRQYIGDYASRPIETYEIPILVRLSTIILNWSESALQVRVNLRALADARNLFWVLLLADIIAAVRLNTIALIWITSFALYVVGAGTFRSTAATAWNLAFVIGWAYLSLRNRIDM